MGRTFVVIDIDTNSCSTELFNFIYPHSHFNRDVAEKFSSNHLRLSRCQVILWRQSMDGYDTSNTDRAWARGITNSVFKENVMLCT